MSGINNRSYTQYGVEFIDFCHHFLRMNTLLPKFNNPPVTEVALGVQYETLVQWQIPHYGLYWSEIRSKYPLCSVLPPLPIRVERYDEEKNSVSFSLPLVPKPEVRCWFFDHEQSWLMQIQNNEFLHNWRKINGQYPRYSEVRERFVREWQSWRQFVDREQIGPIHIRQCEMSYVNLLDIEYSSAALHEIFPPWNARTTEFLSAPESVVINQSFSLPEKLGRLYFSLQPVIRAFDAKEIIQLTILVRGLPTSLDNDGVMDWFDLAHEWAVRGFTDLTSPKMHKDWQRRYES